MCDKGQDTWVSKIRDLLCTNGFGIVWVCKEVGNEKAFLTLFRERLVDCFKQNWSSKMSSSNTFDHFHSFKSLIQREPFLANGNISRHFRNILVKFRLGVSKLNCHRYRFYKNTNLLNCPFCGDLKEDEMHFLLVCNVYEDLRLNILPSDVISRRNEQTMYKLIGQNVYSHTISKYLYFAFKVRSERLKEREKEHE